MKIKDAVHTYDITDTLKAWGGGENSLPNRKVPNVFPLCSHVFYHSFSVCLCCILVDVGHFFMDDKVESGNKRQRKPNIVSRVCGGVTWRVS